MLVGAGHDLDHLLRTYTMEQIEIMAFSVFQHKLTQFRIVTTAIGGDEAGDQIPKGPNSASNRAGGRKATDELEQAHKELAMSQLLGLQSKVAKSTAAQQSQSGIPGEEEALAKGRMLAQLRAAQARVEDAKGD